MPCTTILDISQQEQAPMLAALRRARYGYLLALHVFSYKGMMLLANSGPFVSERNTVYLTGYEHISNR